jgi:hypothetical protein
MEMKRPGLLTGSNLINSPWNKGTAFLVVTIIDGNIRLRRG